MQLSDINFDKYYINPSSTKDIEKITKFPEFKVDLKSLPQKKVITFIVLMYDINNDEISTRYTDYATRKRESAMLAGFKLHGKDGHFESVVEKFLVGENEQVNSMIVRYISLFGLPEYISLIAYYEMLEKEIIVSMGSNYSKSTIDNIKNINGAIEEASKKLFRGDESENLRKNLYRTLQSERLKLRPEYMARQIRDKKIELQSEPYNYRDNG